MKILTKFRDPLKISEASPKCEFFHGSFIEIIFILISFNFCNNEINNLNKICFQFINFLFFLSHERIKKYQIATKQFLLSRQKYIVFQIIGISKMNEWMNR